MSTILVGSVPQARARAKPAAKAGWGVLEWFILVLMVGSALVFLPGAEILRAPIRGLPYALSLAVLVWYLSARSRRVMPAAGKLVLPALILYAANLAHPLTDPVVGLATVVFHLSIAAPVFWAGSLVRDEAHVNRLLWVVFGASLAQVVVGVLQAAFPLVFMPPQLAANPDVLMQQTYMGPFGQMIVRPPGLTDLPGGASTSGTLAAVLGTAFLLRRGAAGWVRALGALAVVAGMFVLYLTQVRAFAVMTVAALLMFVTIAFLQGRGRMIVLGGVGTGILLALAGVQTFGYDPTDPYAPSTRFQELLREGIFDAWMQNRGQFFRQTFDEYVWQYPLGAGLGRWGMMREYFGAGTPFSMIWVEIQPTGWLLDGGILMWFLYGGALLAAMFYSLRLALRRQDPELAYQAAIVLTIQCIVVGSGLAGPVFNTSFGILFWVLTAILYAAANNQEDKRMQANPRAAVVG